jgi:hypothetical protein
MASTQIKVWRMTNPAAKPVLETIISLTPAPFLAGWFQLGNSQPNNPFGYVPEARGG